MAEKQPQPIQYLFTDPTVKTVDDLLQKQDTLFNGYQGKKEDFLKYDGGTGKTNKERIEEQYNDFDEDLGYEVGTEYLKPNTVLLLDPTIVRTDFIGIKGDNQVNNLFDFSAYYVQEYEELKKNPQYRPTLRVIKGDTEVGYSNCYLSVWIYSRAFNMIIDMSAYCMSLDVNSMLQGSNFTLIFPLSAHPGLGTRRAKKNRESNVDIVSFPTKLTKFAQRISTNDIVWIRFEELQMEKDREEFSGLKQVDNSSLAGNVYDLIGLVDTVQQSSKVSSAQGVVTVTGRDLSKLFQDDEAIFQPLATISDSATGNIIIGSTQDDGLIKRNFVSGEYPILFSKEFRDIETTMQFYMNQLSNIGLLPDDINDTFFGSYVKNGNDRRSYTYRVKGTEVERKLMRGLYQIIKLQVDPAVKNMKVVDSSVSQPEGSLLTLFNKLCQEPFVELLLHTYSDVYNIVVRKPPFDKTSLQSLLPQEKGEKKEEGNGDIEQSYHKETQEESGFQAGDHLFNLPASDVASEELMFEDNFYTWYKCEFKGRFIGQNTVLAQVPIIYFSDYVNIWGSRQMQVNSNYTVVGDDGKIGTIESKDQIISDILYVIESTAYLPFTRKGTITLNKGDRRIKPGSWIRYKKTGELFYVEGVMNQVQVGMTSVTRRTTLTVSRGMVEDFVVGKTIRGTLMSYFNLIDLENIKNSLRQFMTAEKAVTKEILVNKEVFEFFLSREQFFDKEGQVWADDFTLND